MTPRGLSGGDVPTPFCKNLDENEGVFNLMQKQYEILLESLKILHTEVRNKLLSLDGGGSILSPVHSLPGTGLKPPPCPRGLSK